MFDGTRQRRAYGAFLQRHLDRYPLPTSEEDLALQKQTPLIKIVNGARCPGNGTVGEYDATTGAAINASFITGLNGPQALALPENTLCVANPMGVGAYDTTTVVD